MHYDYPLLNFSLSNTACLFLMLYICANKYLRVYLAFAKLLYHVAKLEEARRKDKYNKHPAPSNTATTSQGQQANLVADAHTDVPVETPNLAVPVRQPVIECIDLTTLPDDESDRLNSTTAANEGGQQQVHEVQLIAAARYAQSAQQSLQPQRVEYQDELQQPMAGQQTADQRHAVAQLPQQSMQQACPPRQLHRTQQNCPPQALRLTGQMYPVQHFPRASRQVTTGAPQGQESMPAIRYQPAMSSSTGIRQPAQPRQQVQGIQHIHQGQQMTHTAHQTIPAQQAYQVNQVRQYGQPLRHAAQQSQYGQNMLPLGQAALQARPGAGLMAGQQIVQPLAQQTQPAVLMHNGEQTQMSASTAQQVPMSVPPSHYVNQTQRPVQHVQATQQYQMAQVPTWMSHEKRGRSRVAPPQFRLANNVQAFNQSPGAMTTSLNSTYTSPQQVASGFQAQMAYQQLSRPQMAQSQVSQYQMTQHQNLMRRQSAWQQGFPALPNTPPQSSVVSNQQKRARESSDFESHSAKRLCQPSHANAPAWYA